MLRGTAGIQLPNPGIQAAIDEIKRAYSHDVSVDVKAKGLTKFGRNDNIGNSAFETVWLLGDHESYPTGNDIDIITSTDGSDDQEVIVEGHTLSGSDLTFVTQTATLDGTNNVTLATPLYRANRLINNGATDFAGTVTVEDNGTSSHLSTDGTNNQSLKCATSLSSQDYWILTGVSVGVNRQNSRSVDFRLQVREFGKTFRTIFPISSHTNSGTIFIPFDPCLIVKPNSDVRMIAQSSGTTTGVSAAIHGHLAIIQS